MLNGWATTPRASGYNFWGVLRICMALKTLQCCGNASLPEQRSASRVDWMLNKEGESNDWQTKIFKSLDKVFKTAEEAKFGCKVSFPP
jgi:hypothetical protein